MSNPLPIEYLHKIREENYEAKKRLPKDEQVRLSNENGRRIYEYGLKLKRA